MGSVMDSLFTRTGSGQPYLSEEALTALDPLPDQAVIDAAKQQLSIAEALLQVRKETARLLKDGETLSRFSAAYIRTSVLIRKSVTILGQGLMTLHRDGLDLSTYTLTIDELRGIASFHFRKTLNGARVAREKNPAVYYRCIDENLEWVKLLCRLEITGRKLQEETKTLPAAKEVIEAEAAENAARALPEAAPLQSLRALSPLPERSGQPCLPHPAARKNATEPAAPKAAEKAGAPRPLTLAAACGLGAYSLRPCKAPRREKLPAQTHRAPPARDD